MGYAVMNNLKLEVDEKDLSKMYGLLLNDAAKTEASLVKRYNIIKNILIAVICSLTTIIIAIIIGLTIVFSRITIVVDNNTPRIEQQTSIGDERYQE
jgi:cytochrome b subunit of formate dehydrogenase